MSNEIKGFSVVGVSIGKLESIHFLFFKKHVSNPTKWTKINKIEVEDQKNEENRSIFVCNLPINTRFQEIKEYFKTISLGATVEKYTKSVLSDIKEDDWADLNKLSSDLDINVEENNKDELETQEENTFTSFSLSKRCGIITFVDKQSFQLAFTQIKSLSKQEKITRWSEIDGGTTYFLRSYKKQILDLNLLKEKIGNYLNIFNKAEKESIDNLSQKKKIIDEDGFTLVVGDHRKTVAGMNKFRKLSSELSEKTKEKNKKKEKSDFYRFQFREKKKKEMNELMLKFKEDQNKFEEIKKVKSFNPFTNK